MMNLSELLAGKAKDLLSEETKKEIDAKFNEIVKEAVDSRVKLEVEAELTKMDEAHTQALNELLSKLDEDHSKKFELAIKKLDEDHCKKFDEITKLYESQNKKQADELITVLSESISQFLDAELEKAIPKEQIQEAVKNTQAAKLLEQIKDIVVLDKEFVNESMVEALKDGKQLIDSLEQKATKLVHEKALIEKELNDMKLKTLLSEKTAAFTQDKKDFVLKMLSGKTTDEVNKNFEYVVEMFERQEKNTADKLVSEATDKAVSTQIKEMPKVDQPKTNEKPSLMTEYLNGLK